MTNLCCKLLRALNGRTFATAESCTGGGIGAAFTAVPGSSSVYKGGVISYTNWVKKNVLAVKGDILAEKGAVSEETAGEMAIGVQKLMQTDFALSVTGIAGPGTDDFNTPVGTVFIGVADSRGVDVSKFRFNGDRDSVRKQATEAAIEILISVAEKTDRY